MAEEERVVVARCVQCDGEFTEQQLEGQSACPDCGTRAIPCDPKKDTTIKINTHELRILTIWADNWAQAHCDAQGKKTLSCILQRLSQQLPGTAFTLGGEIRDLQDAGYDAQLITADGEVKVPPRGKPS
jgi:DNA-directed RNA polymerase subunit RPC12/RpoP